MDLNEVTGDGSKSPSGNVENDPENSNAIDIDPEKPQGVEVDPEKIKGDAIGDTVYSERYVLKILIQLSQYGDDKWNEEFEADLCILWDMTATPAVVDFLMKHNCLNLIIPVLQSTSNPRLLEILVGILGNMCCVKEVRAELSEDQGVCEVLVQMLSCPDPQTLIQLARCFQSFTWDLLRCDLTVAADQHWFEKEIVSGQFASQLAFILSSSLCEELLTAVLDLLYTLCGLEINDKDYSRYFASTEMIDGMMESWTQLFLCCKEGSTFEFPNKQLEKSALQWVSILLAFAGQEQGRELLGRKTKQVTAAVLNWVQEPQDGFDSLLISTIALLEALVRFYFCQEAFCKIIRVVRKTSEKSTVWEGVDEEDRKIVLSLRESFGNYCLEVLQCVERSLLDSVLVRCCNEKSIRFFWQVVEEREPDYVSSSGRTR